MNGWIELESDLEKLTHAVMEESIDEIQKLITKLKIKNVAQVALEVPQLDVRFPAVNMFTVSLHHAKTKVLNFLLD